MSATPRLRLPFPDNRRRDWYDQFAAFGDAIDDALFGLVENQGVFLAGSGTITWNGSTGVLSWSAPLVLYSPTTGFAWTLAAGTATLADGEYLYAPITRAPTEGVTVAAGRASFLADPLVQIALAKRVGAALHWRNGASLPGTRTVAWADLASPLEADLLAALRAASAPSQSNPFATMADVVAPGLTASELVVATNEERLGTHLGATAVVGTYYYDPALLVGVTSLTLRVEGFTSSVAYTGTVVLYDPVASTALATVTFTSTTPVCTDEPVASVPGSARLLWLQMTSPSGGSGDFAKLTRAVLLPA